MEFGAIARARVSLNDTGCKNTPVVNVDPGVVTPVVNAVAVGALRPVGSGTGSVTKRRVALGVAVWGSINSISLSILQKTLSPNQYYSVHTQSNHAQADYYLQPPGTLAE
jgi:hypothetical protein